MSPTFSLFFRWFRHITEASNAYKSRESTRRGQAQAQRQGQGGPDHNGLEASGGASAKSQQDLLGVPDGVSGGKPAARSQSFHGEGSRGDDENGFSKKTGA